MKALKKLLFGFGVAVNVIIASVVLFSFTPMYEKIWTTSALEGFGDEVSPLGIAADAITNRELSATTVTPGTYTVPSITVDDDGRLTAASNGRAPDQIFVSWDGLGSFVSAGNTIYRQFPTACTISGWSILATGSSPTCTIDIWKISSGTALPTVSNTIMGTKPALATGNALRSSTLTGWTTSISAGDILAFNIDAAGNATQIIFTLEVN